MWNTPLFISGRLPVVDITISRKDFRQVCKYLQQQLHAIPLLHLMTSTNPKMDWCSTLYFTYGHNVTSNFDYTLSRFNDCFATHRQIDLDLMVFYLTFIKYGMRLYG